MKRHGGLITAVGFWTAFSAVSRARADTPFFMGLGDLPGGTYFSTALAISADGSAIVGYSRSSASGDNREAFRWTLSGGMQGLGDVPGGNFDSWGFGISGDGRVAVGRSNAQAWTTAFRWTETSGMVPLPGLPNADNKTREANAASFDGSVIVGKAYDSQGYGYAVRWTASGIEKLGTAPLGGLYGVAEAVSPDGNVIVGIIRDRVATTIWKAFRWTSSGGMVGLGDLPGGDYFSRAYDVSDDGTVVVGDSDSAHSDVQGGMYEAFRWTAAEGMVPLGDLPGGWFGSYASGVSGDGSVIVGGSYAESRSAFIWDAEHGMRKLQDVLTYEHRLDLTGWHLESASDISADGTSIVGVAINPSGLYEAYVVHIPEPSSVLTILLGALAGIRRSR